LRPEDFDRFAEVVAGFAELKGKQLSAPAIELYWRAMQHWTLEEFRQAASYLLRTCQFMPTPKEFEELRKAGRPTPGEAWQRALGHCASGEWRTGAGCGDPSIDATVAMCGGWQAIALCGIDKLGFIERRFAEHYESAEDRNDARHALPELAWRNGKALPAGELLKVVVK
jgi:hypothetical protein